MGSGASTLTNEQKAEIAKQMKEKYESIDPSEQPTSQENLMKHYEEVMAKVTSETAQPIGLPAGKKKLKKRIARMRSFENGKFLLENVAHPKKTPEDPEQDFWDSVSTQPYCLICKMVFSSETKRDTHMKYSEVHLKNVEALAEAEKLKESGAAVPSAPVTKPEAPSFRCRELYSGSKFYWRLQDTLEFHLLYLHLESNCIEVIPYDNHSQKEYDRLYFDETKAYELVGPDKIAERVKERLEEITKENEKANHVHPPELPKQEDLLADERRQSIVTLLMSKLQLHIPNKETGIKVVEFKVTLPEGAVTPLLSIAPNSVKPVLVKRRRLSTTEEIEKALAQANELELQVNVKLHEAEDLENLAHVN